MIFEYEHGDEQGSGDHVKSGPSGLVVCRVLDPVLDTEVRPAHIHPTRTVTGKIASPTDRWANVAALGFRNGTFTLPYPTAIIAT